MLEANQIYVVDNGDLYLGTYDEDTLVIGDAFFVESTMRDTGDSVSKEGLRSFITAQNTPGALKTIKASPNSSISYRQLSEDEQADYNSLMVLFKRAEQIALPKLINKEFNRLGK